MLIINSERVHPYGYRLRVADESWEEYQWIIDHLDSELKGHAPRKVYGLRDSGQNRLTLMKLFKAHGVEVTFGN